MWEEQKLNEGRQEGRLVGRSEGREEERERILRLADRHLDAATASAFMRLINANLPAHTAGPLWILRLLASHTHPMG